MVWFAFAPTHRALCAEFGADIVTHAGDPACGVQECSLEQPTHQCVHRNGSDRRCMGRRSLMQWPL